MANQRHVKLTKELFVTFYDKLLCTFIHNSHFYRGLGMPTSKHYHFPSLTCSKEDMNLPSGRIKPSTGSKPSSPMRQPRAEQPQRGFWGALVSYMGIEGDTGDLINEGKRYQFRQVSTQAQCLY